jgi:hypothetical protein
MFQSLDLTEGYGDLLGEFYWEEISPWRGASSTLNTGACPKDAVASSLLQILQAGVPSKYYLSAKACLGILRRADERGKELPAQLKFALMAQAGLIRTWPMSGALLAYHINQRDEGIDLHGVSGALMATSNMQMQTFITGAPAAFAANQRDEVRDLHDIAAAICTRPGVKQQTFISESCLTPWDEQDFRVFAAHGTSPTLLRKAPTLAHTEKDGCKSADVVFTAGFCAGAAPTAGGVGYQEDCSPTLKASESGTNTPLVAQAGDSVICIAGNAIDRQPQNGGNGLGCQEDVAYTLTATDHHAVFTRQRVDAFRDDEIASTQSARQHKDATDLVCQPTPYQDTVGALTESDCKGPNNQAVSQDKCVVEQTLYIRRLTPLECERLQGFPDGWTDLPDASDTARYKALGNSVAIPCVEYIFRGIVQALGEDQGFSAQFGKSDL